MEWLSKNQMNIFGTLCMLAALLHTGTEAAIYYVGGLLCWGAQQVLEEITKERVIKFEPFKVKEKEDV
jgi:hypothetical protein